MDITILSFCPNEKHQIHIIQKFLQKIPGHPNMLFFFTGDDRNGISFKVEKWT